VRLRTGLAFARATGVALRHLPGLLLAAAVFYVPFLAVRLLWAADAWAERHPFAPRGLWDRMDLQYLFTYAQGGGLGRVATFLDGVLPWLVQGTVTLAVLRALARRPAGILRSVFAGLGRSHLVLGAGLFPTLLAAACLIAPHLLLGGWVERWPVVVRVEAVFVQAALLSAFLVAGPIAVAERLTPIAALGRSGDLTAGSRWGLFVLALLVLGPRAGLDAAVRATWAEPATWGAVRLAVALRTAVDALAAVLLAVLAAVAYEELRGSREGTTVEDLVRVFE
jgi:hypothetical protein